MKAAENLISQSKNRFIAVFVPGNLKDFRKTGRVTVVRELAFPSAGLSKPFFDRLSR